MYYLPAAPPDVIRDSSPHFIAHPPHPGFPIPAPEALALSIGKQLEYYFSDENLQKDPYLLSLMDDQGWVSISKIADFNRVKKMTSNIPFLLDAFRSSNNIELQGDKIRKRVDWSKWLGRNVISSKPQAQNGLQEFPPSDESLRQYSPSKKDTAEVGESFPECDSEKVLSSGEARELVGDSGDANRAFTCTSTSEVHPPSFADHEHQSMEEQSTFMLDEELNWSRQLSSKMIFHLVEVGKCLPWKPFTILLGFAESADHTMDTNLTVVSCICI
ncbi:hypothetical protein NE237_003174 [Protea cynaroides]|uniref:HTH La-type RNA-binding domain-containing protein n=1 Tax=Protea cynaroides TaxID=273540 RepID=A0A9Q0QS69_9MAGN|nr:hypothetical protein NE237_003174 [Protea cynaroides]